jgi:AraC family transcriptional regulator, regulatory protein of adaptative response / methylated-DNA-[protein]-cysteine methyltransferase
MNQMTNFAADVLDDDARWAAVLRRDRGLDGRFVTGVLTTGIYCRPSCAARHPARTNVRFFADGPAARATGLRACKRCLPDDVARDEAAVAKALKLLADEELPALEDLAAAVGYAPHHFHRLFKRSLGVTPAVYARGLRADRAQAALSSGASVTAALYDAGYSGPSRFYADSKGRLGMTPSAWKNGGAGVTIRWTIAATSLGPMLVAATDKGICRLSFDEGEGDLAARFPNAILIAADPAMAELVSGAVAAVERPRDMPSLPLDVAGTAFQQAVWQELTRIPAGETRSYAEIAAAVGKPAAVRAAGSANGANNVAVLIPCHRVVRSDGTLGGYAYGLERKAELLAREQENAR